MLRVMFNGQQYTFDVNPNSTVLDFKKQISSRLNLVYESLVLSHLGVEMYNQQLISEFCIDKDSTMISLQFDIKKP
jgi:hypothetical protein